MLWVCFGASFCWAVWRAARGRASPRLCLQSEPFGLCLPQLGFAHSCVVSRRRLCHSSGPGLNSRCCLSSLAAPPLRSVSRDPDCWGYRLRGCAEFLTAARPLGVSELAGRGFGGQFLVGGEQKHLAARGRSPCPCSGLRHGGRPRPWRGRAHSRAGRAHGVALPPARGGGTQGAHRR